MAGHRASNRLSVGGVQGNPGDQNRAAMEISRKRAPGVAAKSGNQGKRLSGLRAFAATAATAAYPGAKCVAQSSGGMGSFEHATRSKARAGALQKSDTSRQDKNVGWHGACRATSSKARAGARRQ